MRQLSVDRYRIFLEMQIKPFPLYIASVRINPSV